MDVIETAVIFRKFKSGDIVALLPYEIHIFGKILSYLSIIGYKDSDLSIVRKTVLASPEEYNDLLNELRNRYDKIIPSKECLHKFKIMKRVHWGNHLKAVMSHKNRDRCLPMG